MGFTAINSPGPATAGHPGTNPAAPATSTTSSAAQSSNVLANSKSAPKKAAAKSKKRAVTAPDAKNAKRRKTSSVADEMPAAKPRAKQSSKQSRNKVNPREAGLQHEQPATATNSKAKGKASQEAVQNAARAADPTSAAGLVSVIAPSTSMHAFQSVPQQTAFNAAQSSSGGGAMLYSSGSSPTKQQNSSVMSQTTMAKAHRSSKKADGNSNARHNRKAKEQGSDIEFGTPFDELAQHSELKEDQSGTRGGTRGGCNGSGEPRRQTRSVTQKARQHAVAQAAPSSEDDFGSIEDDDDLLTAMELTRPDLEDPSSRALHEAMRAPRQSSTRVARQDTAQRTALCTQDDFGSMDDDDNELAAAVIVAEKASAIAKDSKTASPTRNTMASQSMKQRCSMPSQTPTPAHSDAIASSVTFANGSGADEPVVDEQVADKAVEHVVIENNDEMMISSDEEDEDIIELEKAMRAAEKAGLKPRLHKHNVHVVDRHENYGGALLDEAEKKLLGVLRSSSQNTEPKPIVRTPFPDPVLDRSPLFGASNNTVLRTCFRLGEALNVGAQAVRCNKAVVLEIYARVVASSRDDDRKQHFIFRDLYHDKPPHLEGDFALWNQSRLWELDGRAFLAAGESSEGVMCRAIAKMKRDGTKWRLEVLSVWKASWEDIEAVAGIYRKGSVSMEEDG